MRDGRHRSVIETRTGLVLLCVLGVAITGGCSKPTPPPVAYSGPTLSVDHLGFKEAPRPDTGYVILETEPSQGRFPAAMAVARLDQPSLWEQRNGVPADRWQLGTIPEEQATYWNALFNTVMPVREVVVLDRRSVEMPTSDVRRISLSANRARFTDTPRPSRTMPLSWG